MITKKTINVPIYDYRIYVTIFDDEEEFRENYSKYVDASCTACTLEYSGQCRCELVIPSNDYSLVVHELEHVKNLIWKSKGYKPQADNDEPDAYLIGWLFEQVDKIIKKHLSAKQ